MKMIVESITQTCGACPSQWEGKLTDGRMFYARYRWGGLNVEVSKGPMVLLLMKNNPTNRMLAIFETKTN